MEKLTPRRAALLALLLGGCSQSPGRPDAGVEADAGEPPPVDAGDYCSRLAGARCSSAMLTCCNTLGRPYGQAACRDAVVSTCEEHLTVVRSGNATLDLTKTQACLDGWAAAFATCFVSEGQYFKLLASCAQPINGRTALGGTCDQLFLNRDCRSPSDGIAICRGVAIRNSTCELYRSVAPVNGSCGGERLCDDGLSCRGSICQPEQPLGASCANQQPCGPSLICDAGTCSPGLGGGAACSEGRECASGTCTANLENPNGVCLDGGTRSSLIAQYCN